MKINKLLFFLLALVSLNSCVEYVDNGTKPDGTETPEQQVFKAMHSNPEEAKYVNDKFTFEATLNGVDVTSTTKFRVNGVDIPGNSYVPFKEGSHSVLATMDDFTANFKFTVLEEDTTPEPTGNRIEYGGNSYPVSEVLWIVNTNAQNQLVKYTRNGIDCTLWGLYALEVDDSQTPPVVINRMITAAYVPMKDPSTVYFPNEVPASSLEYVNGGSVTINGSKVFDTTGATYTIASTGNSASQDVFNVPQPWTGTANYTITATGANSGNSAQLFWDGAYTAVADQIAGKSAKGNNIHLNLDLNKIKNLKTLNPTEIKNLKIAKY
ncbi:hypothetical protein MG290_08085 [Flavobacterium sp. CBA20B-1]|uniref:hypothetical protein n=1 Tax=unclassified Flavobacterium TaxID=196869 RepID=UPI0022253D37|nr:MULTISPECIES: hypothetical protein [unclassified Flavobacterium]WCM40924.1 hypothetical protein MG290_08085 [Flavobacterium sp. CBA20B-1]